jgi:c-di-GMP-binding flagellar brake protein YcgR
MKKRPRESDKKLRLRIDFDEKRRFIRHPVCYPLTFRIKTERSSEKSSTLNISEGGLLFLSKRPVKTGSLLALNLPFEDQIFKVEARVMHVEPEEGHKLFNIGVAFHRISDALKVKLLEQIYLIDEYRHLRSIQLGHEISLKEASEEWIKLYSKQFKKMYW